MLEQGDRVQWETNDGSMHYGVIQAVFRADIAPDTELLVYWFGAGAVSLMGHVSRNYRWVVQEEPGVYQGSPADSSVWMFHNRGLDTDFNLRKRE